MPSDTDELEPTSTDIAVASYKCASGSDDALDPIVRKVNEIYVTRGLQTALQIGELLIEQIFDGDLSACRDRGRSHPSFRRLAEREDLRPSASFLWTSCAVVEQVAQLPAEVALSLPLSHHRLLLPVRDVEQKVELAVQATKAELSRREFATQVTAAIEREPRRSRGGRPRLPAMIKGLRRLRDAVVMLRSEAIDAAAIDRATADSARDVLADLEEQVQALIAIQQEFRQAIGDDNEGGGA